MSKEEAILSSALKIAKRDGLINLTRGALCEDANIPYSTFTFHTGMNFTDYTKHLEPMLPKDALSRPLAKTRATKEERKESIMTCALSIATEKGYRNVSPSEVGEMAGVTRQCVIHYTGTKDQLRKSILRLATVTKNIPILGQALTDKDIKISDDLRAEVLDYLLKGN